MCSELNGVPTAIVVGEWVYLDGGDFSYVVDGVPNFYYCGSDHINCKLQETASYAN